MHVFPYYCFYCTLLLYIHLLLSYSYAYSKAPLLGLFHWSQETRSGRPKQSVWIPDLISSPPTGALLSVPRGWASFIRCWRSSVPTEAGQLHHRTLGGLQPSERTWHLIHMHTQQQRGISSREVKNLYRNSIVHWCSCNGSSSDSTMHLIHLHTSSAANI